MKKINIKYVIVILILLFSPASFGEFMLTGHSISELIEKGFQVKQIDSINFRSQIYHLRLDEIVAICYVNFERYDTECIVDFAGNEEKWNSITIFLKQ